MRRSAGKLELLCIDFDVSHAVTHFRRALVRVCLIIRLPVRCTWSVRVVFLAYYRRENGIGRRQTIALATLREIKLSVDFAALDRALNERRNQLIADRRCNA